MCAGNIKKWYEYAPHMFWADRVTTQKSTGMTPYYAAHGVEPLHPFDITEATFLAARINSHLVSSLFVRACSRNIMRTWQLSIIACLLLDMPPSKTLRKGMQIGSATMILELESLFWS